MTVLVLKSTIENTVFTRLAFLLRRLFKGGAHCKISYFFKSLTEDRERSGLFSVPAKFSALSTELRIAKILKRELDGRAAKYGHFQLRNVVLPSKDGVYYRVVYL